MVWDGPRVRAQHGQQALLPSLDTGPVEFGEQVQSLVERERPELNERTSDPTNPSSQKSNYLRRCRLKPDQPTNRQPNCTP
jgi:hypothetical protein